MTSPQASHLRVTRTARYYTLGDASAPVNDLWYVLHGYSELAGAFVQQFDAIAEPGRLIVAPEALMRYYTDHAARTVGATWMTSEDRLTDIADYVRYLDQLHEHVVGGMSRAPARTRVLGFSQGAATATRWAVQGQILTGELVLWGSSIPPDLDLDRDIARLRAWALTFVLGRRDHYITDEALERERARLDALELDYETVTFDGGHRLDDETLRALAGRTRTSHT